MEKMFIAQLEITKNYYMENRQPTHKEVHLVKATNEENASAKLMAFYENKDKDYEVSHHVDILSINELIK